MICPKCFNTNDDNNNNCVYCGNVLKEVASTPVAPTVPEFTPATNPVPPVQGLNTVESTPVQPTPEVQPQVTPEVQPQVVPEVQQQVAPEVTQVATPEVTQQPQSAGIDLASVSLTTNKTAAPQVQLSEDPFMNQILQQQAAPKQPPKVDVKKIANNVMPKLQALIKNKFVIIGAGALAVILVGVGIFNLLHKPSEEELMKGHPEYANAFFFQGDDDKYALVSKEGKLLTDFEFDSEYYSFLGGYTVVSKDDEVGIMKDNGKMSVKYGKYDSIIGMGSLYLATKSSNDDYKAYYITGDGKKVISNLENWDYKTSSDYLTAFKHNNNAVVYNYKGDKVITMGYDSDLFIHDKDVYAAIYSDGQVAIVNAQTSKVIAKFKDKETYCINGVNEDGSIISINTCDNSWINYNDDEEDFKLIVDGKVIDTESECDSVSVQYETVICVKDDKRYLLDDKYERSVSLDEEIAYIDGANYAIYNDGSVSIYKKGKKVNTIDNVDDLSTGKIIDSYLVEKENGKIVYYDLDGKEICDVDYSSANPFDENERSIVYKDREYFLINKEGKQVAGPYSFIYSYSDFYVVKDKDDNYGVIDKDNKVIVELSYDDVDVYANELKFYLALEKDDKYSVYSVSDKKNIINSVEDVDFETNYIKVKNGESFRYFTYNGKQFYEK